MADAMADTSADVISLKVGINIVGARAMDRRTFVPALHGFLDRIRRLHAKTPTIVASRILWPGCEQTPGPAVAELDDAGVLRSRPIGDPADTATGTLTLEIAREHLQHVVQVRQHMGEPIHYLDGLKLYCADDVTTSPLPDGLHPDATIYEMIGRRFARLAFGETGLAQTTSMH